MTAPYKVVLTDGALSGGEDLEREILRSSGLDVTLERHECRDSSALVPLCAGADGLVVSFAPITSAVIDAMPACRIVAYMATGYDSVDLDYATAKGIVVTNAGPYCSNEVADHAMAMVLSLSRRLVALDRSVHEGSWDSSACGSPGALREQTVGVIGFGRIGSRVALRARAFGLRVVACDPYVERSPMELLGVEKVGLEQLLDEADYVTLHCALTAETKGVLGAEQLDLLKPTACLVNTARGECVDSDALAAALGGGRLAGAGLDVTWPEPLPAGHPLRDLPNVILTPHAAFHSERSLAALRATPFNAVADALSGRVPENVVNPSVIVSRHCRLETVR